MRNILKVETPNDYARFVDAPVLHPLISIIHYDELAPFRHSLNNYGVYGLFIQRQFPHNLSYGMRKLQVSDASIIAVEPGQIGGLEDNGERISLCGWVLLWSPELLHGTELERQIDRYQFFSYFFDGSLRMEPDEWLCITQLVTQMRQELQTHEDSPSLRNVLLGYLHLILEYCNRIYQRQLFEEDRGEADLLKRFHNLLQTYFRENRQLMQGLPTVAWCAFRTGLFASLFWRYCPQGNWWHSYWLHPQLRYQSGENSVDAGSQHQRDLPPARIRFPPPFYSSLQAHHGAYTQRVLREKSTVVFILSRCHPRETAARSLVQVILM